MSGRSPSAAKERPDGVLSKLETLAARVWATDEIDDLEARSILAYIAKLEEKVISYGRR